MSEQIVEGYMRVRTIDGPRKGRDYYFKLGQLEFGINTPMCGDVRHAFNGTMSGYGQYIYKVVAFWGASQWSRVYAGVYERTAYNDPQKAAP